MTGKLAGLQCAARGCFLDERIFIFMQCMLDYFNPIVHCCIVPAFPQTPRLPKTSLKECTQSPISTLLGTQPRPSRFTTLHHLLIPWRRLIRRGRHPTRRRTSQPHHPIIRRRRRSVRPIRRNRRRPLYLHRLPRRNPPAQLLIRRQLLQIDIQRRTATVHGPPARPRRLHGLRQRLLDALVRRVEVERAAFFEGQLQGQGPLRVGDPAAGHGHQEAFPHVGAEEGGCDVGVLEGEEGGGEGFEGWALGLLGLLGCVRCEADDWGGVGGEVDELAGLSVGWLAWGEEGVTRWFVMMALPSVHLTEKGSLPGKLFDVCMFRAVRGSEVRRVFSLERGTKAWGPSSMTQLLLLAGTHPVRAVSEVVD